MTQDEIEKTARRRLRSLRKARGWSLDELAKRSHIGASTISRIETGQRRLALDHLSTLAKALGTSIDNLLVDDEAGEVVIHPRTDTAQGSTYWMLTPPDDPSGRIVAKIKLSARKRPPESQVHPGRERIHVLSGAVRLVLGDQEHIVETGKSADFDTMTPHSLSGIAGPAEVISMLDRHGEQAHLRDH